MPSSIQARLRFKPSRCASLGSLGSVTTAGSQPRAGAIGRKLRHEPAQPAGKILRREHTPHDVGLGQTRREEILAGRFVGERAVLVLLVVVASFAQEQVEEGAVVGRARIVDHQPHGKRGLAVLAGAHRIGKLRQPGLEAAGGSLLQRTQVGGELLRQRIRRRIVVSEARLLPLPQFLPELEQPRQSVGPLEAGAAFGVQVGSFLREVGGGQALARARYGQRPQTARREKCAAGGPAASVRGRKSASRSSRRRRA